MEKSWERWMIFGATERYPTISWRLPPFFVSRNRIKKSWWGVKKCATPARNVSKNFFFGTGHFGGLWNFCHSHFVLHFIPVMSVRGISACGAQKKTCLRQCSAVLQKKCSFLNGFGPQWSKLKCNLNHYSRNYEKLKLELNGFSRKSPRYVT